MPLGDVFRELPPSVRGRFRHLQHYVREQMYPDDEYQARLKRFKKKDSRQAFVERAQSEVEGATLIVLAFLLRRFFEEGHQAAVTTVDTFAELGIQEIRIGKLLLSGRNESVMMGKILADALLESFAQDQALATLLTESRSVRDLIYQYREHYGIK